MDCLKVCVIMAVSVSLAQATGSTGIPLDGKCTPPTTTAAPTTNATTTVATSSAGKTSTAKPTTTTPTPAPSTTTTTPNPTTATQTTTTQVAGRKRRQAPGSTCIDNAVCDPHDKKCVCASGFQRVNGTTADTCEPSGAASTLSSAPVIVMLTFWLLSTLILK